ELRRDKLASIIPTVTYGGGAIADPAHTLVIHSTIALSKARGTTLAFYTDDARFESLWRDPEHHVQRFLTVGVSQLVEPDYSLWIDDALIVQAFNIFRTRRLARYWQDAGLRIIPNLSWSNEDSFSFCFSGIPTHAPVVAVECRTARAPEDRAAFFL